MTILLYIPFGLVAAVVIYWANLRLDKSIGDGGAWVSMALAVFALTKSALELGRYAFS